MDSEGSSVFAIIGDSGIGSTAIFEFESSRSAEGSAVVRGGRVTFREQNIVLLIVLFGP